jgi:LysR family transcriptional regulator, nitrogen assimilation regulatory protein
VDIKQLRAFVTSVKSGSITTAAHLLRIAQPALSRQIQLLEDELGTPLLRRSPKGVVPTPAGQVLYDNALDILLRMERLRGAVAQAAIPSRPQLRVAVPPTLSHRLGSRFLAMCESDCPGVALRVTESWSGYISELLDAGLVDFGVMSECQVGGFHLRAPILSEELFLAQRRDGSVPDQTPIRAVDLGGIPLVLPTKLHGVRKLVEEVAASLGISLRVSAEADAWGTIRSLVEAGTFSTILSLREMTDSIGADKIVFRPIVEPTIKNVFFLIAAEKQNQDFDREEVFNGLVKSIRTCLRDPTPPVLAPV